MPITALMGMGIKETLVWVCTMIEWNKVASARG